MRKLNKATIDLIKHFEGLSLKPYLDSIKLPTIGIGTTIYPDGRKVSMSDAPITQEQAEQYLEFDLKDKIDAVEKLVKIPINDNQFGALVSFAYNLGSGALGKSTLLKLLNTGNVSGAAEEFLKWDNAGGKKVAGLTRRRQAERALFLQPMSSADASLLPDIPSEQEIDDKLKNIEDDLK